MRSSADEGKGVDSSLRCLVLKERGNQELVVLAHVLVVFGVPGIFKAVLTLDEGGLLGSGVTAGEDLGQTIGESTDSLWQFRESNIKGDEIVVEAAHVELFHQLNGDDLAEVKQVSHVERSTNIVLEVSSLLDLNTSLLG